ncbi:MAG: response regulator [Spirochaetales bacterium]|nr:response regulator [Spirochaetales bacterium]
MKREKSGSASSSRISHKVFLTFAIVIGLPILGLSLMLTRISGGVETARLEDRFAYASAYLSDTVNRKVSFVVARTRQLSEDPRYTELAHDNGKLATSLAVLAAEYELDGLAWEQTDGGLRSHALSEIDFEAAGYGPGLTGPPLSATVDTGGIRIFCRVSTQGGTALIGAVSIERSALEVLSTAMDADFDIIDKATGQKARVLLTTRRDPFGRNLAGAFAVPLPEPGNGSSLGAPSRSLSGDGAYRTVRSTKLPDVLSASYLAAVSLPSPDTGVSEAAAYVAAITMAAVILALAAGLILSRQLVQPITNLANGVETLLSCLESDQELEPLEVSTNDEVGRLTASFNRMSAELKEAHTTLLTQNRELKKQAEIKADFLATTSAELRSPLNTMVALAETMLSAPQLGGAERDTADLIARTGRRLYGLIDDIQDYSRLEHQDLSIQKKPVELKPLTDIALRFCADLKKPDVGFFNLVDPDIFVLADESRLEQILYHLVGQAAGSTERGAISVKAHSDGRTVRISVTDTGGDPSHSAGGTAGGFGLPIARLLVDLHGGTLKTESLPGQGSQFEFELAAAARPDQAQPASIPDAPPIIDEVDDLIPLDDEGPFSDSTRFRVLVVEGDPACLRILENGLRDRYDVLVAANGQDALTRLAESPAPDLVLMSVMLPKLSGFEVCSLIRKERPGASLPVILMSARTRPADIESAFMVGANDIVAKPVSIIELRARLKTHIELAKVTEAYSRFVPTEFLGLLGRDGILQTALGDHVQGVMTLLVSDIRGFRQLFSRLGPSAIFQRVNNYLSKIGPAVRSNGGFIDLYICDSLMAIFPRSPKDAVRAAVAMRAALSQYNDELSATGEERIEAGIAIHTGDLMLGTVGETLRMDRTIISDAVELAFKLETQTKLFGAQVIVSGTVVEGLKQADEDEYTIRYLGTGQFRPEDSPVPMYELILPDGSQATARKAELRGRFERAVFMYDSGDYENAYAAFLELGRDLPEDPAWKVFIDKTLAARGYHAGQGPVS